jgi:hypothetical protein
MTNSLHEPSKAIADKQNRKSYKEIPRAVGLGAMAIILFGGIGMLFALLPDFRPPSTLSLVTVLTFSVTIAICIMWNILRPNWWASFIAAFSIASLILAAAIHSLGYVLSNWIWFLPLLGVYLLAWALPAINLRLAKFLHTEQTTPQTRSGQGCMTVALSVLGIAGPLGAIVGLGSSRLYGSGVSMIVVGVIFAAVSIGFAQSFSYQLWAKRPQNVKLQD